ncbi:hypothetical protein MTO96_024121 [Rhipicephalus appendiculatus]
MHSPSEPSDGAATPAHEVRSRVCADSVAAGGGAMVWRGGFLCGGSRCSSFDASGRLGDTCGVGSLPVDPDESPVVCWPAEQSPFEASPLTGDDVSGDPARLRTSSVPLAAFSASATSVSSCSSALGIPVADA